MTGNELRFIRRAMGLLQREFATLIGKTEDHLSRMERDVVPITKSTELAVRHFQTRPGPAPKSRE
jgi:transcriptional regulator with XRE-family HTH domain